MDKGLKQGPEWMNENLKAVVMNQDVICRSRRRKAIGSSPIYPPRFDNALFPINPPLLWRPVSRV